MSMKVSTGETTGEIASRLARDARLASVLIEDFKGGLVSLIRDRTERDTVAKAVMEALRAPRGGIELARGIVAPYREKFWEQFRERGNVVLTRVEAEFREMLARIPASEKLLGFDWGTGTGRYPGALKKIFPRSEISGGDVIDYRTIKDFPFYPIVNNKVPQIRDESQDAVLLSFVLHHERYPEQIVGELSRIVRPEGRVVVFEHNPQGDTPAQHNLERQRIHFADLLHTVVWQNVDIPVPGTYKTRDEWKGIFESRGFSLVRDDAFEGTPLLYGARQLLVFERVDADLTSLRPPAGGRAKFKGR